MKKLLLLFLISGCCINQSKAILDAYKDKKKWEKRQRKNQQINEYYDTLKYILENDPNNIVGARNTIALLKNILKENRLPTNSDTEKLLDIAVLKDNKPFVTLLMQSGVSTNHKIESGGLLYDTFDDCHYKALCTLAENAEMHPDPVGMTELLISLDTRLDYERYLEKFYEHYLEKFCGKNQDNCVCEYLKELINKKRK